ncbi:MAG: hypothetical protein WCX71_03755 [Candidatus Buchananbacteria bacterium]
MLKHPETSSFITQGHVEDESDDDQPESERPGGRSLDSETIDNEEKPQKDKREVQTYEVGVPGATQELAADLAANSRQESVRRIEDYDIARVKDSISRSIADTGKNKVTAQEAAEEIRNVTNLFYHLLESGGPDQIMVAKDETYPGDKFLISKENEEYVKGILRGQHYEFSDLAKNSQLGFRAQKGEINLVFLFGQQK